jgi:5-methylthioadenosine/S-adenosylhomocysteine deaminase
MTPSAADSPVDLIISACTVLVHDDQERIGFAENDDS